jgi:ribosomal protein S4
MTVLELKRILTTPITELGLKQGVERRYKLRPTIDVVRKYEELKYKYLTAQKQEDAEKMAYYGPCLDVLRWVLCDKSKDY